MTSSSKISFTVIWLTIAAFAFGLLIGFLATRTVVSDQFNNELLGEDVSNDNATTCARENGAYQFTNPLLLCNSPEDQAADQYTALENQVSSFIKQTTGSDDAQSGDQESVSVYYQDFNSGKWFGVNGSEQYSPASLLKVPIMIAYYKESQTDPTLMSEALTYSGATDSNTGETFKSTYDITPGTYTIAGLIKSMIVNSDNNALDLLTQNVDQNVLGQLYSYLGVPVDQSSSVDYMTAESYAQFFRILYNATYLSKNNSEEALELLVSAEFPEGLRGGVPASVPIAQKFGERTDQYPDGVVQERDLHDCGIVYYPNDPYLLCVMTKMIVGNTEQAGPASADADFENLSGLIQGVSRIVYQDVSKGDSVGIGDAREVSTTTPQ